VKEENKLIDPEKNDIIAIKKFINCSQSYDNIQKIRFNRSDYKAPPLHKEPLLFISLMR